MRDPPAAVLALADTGEALIRFEGITAGRDEVDHCVKIGADQCRIGRRRLDLAIEFVGEKSLAAGTAEDVLRQHIEGAGARRLRVLRIGCDRVDRGAAFQHFKPVGRNEYSL